MATFDRAAAKRAGYTDAEINAHLANHPELTEADPRGQIGTAQAAQRVAGQFPSAMAKLVGSSLPTIGAIGGSLAVPEAAPAAWLLRMLAAGGGGAAGAAGQQYASGAPLNPRDIAMEGALQGGLQGAGEGLMAGAKGAARGLMRGALRPSATMLARSPSLVEDALAAGVKVRGVGDVPREALAMRSGSAAKARAMVSAANQTGTRLTLPEMTQRLMALRNEWAAADPTNARVGVLDDFINEFANKWQGGASAAQADALKRSAQKAAQGVFRAEQAGGLASDVQSASARAQQAVAKGVRTALGEKVPGLNAQNAVTQRGIALVKAANRAPTLAPNKFVEGAKAVTGGFGGFAAGHNPSSALAGALAAHYLTTPQMLSRQALVLNNPALLAALLQGPRLATFAVRDATQ